MNFYLKTPLCLAVLAFCSAHVSVHAQSQSELKKELEDLKSKVLQLEQKMQPSAPNALTDSDDFNRIRAKVEAAEDNSETLGFKGLKISGMMDPTFVYSKRRDSAGFVFLNNFDGRGNSGSDDGFAFDNSYFGAALLDFQKETEGAQKWRLTLAPHKSASSGYNYGSIVHEASVSLPLDGSQTRVFAGQLPDWSGYEYLWSNQQPLISHNLLFDFTIPSFYSGAGMEFTSGKWVSKFLVGNINQARRQPASAQTTDPDTGVVTEARRGEKKFGLTYRADRSLSEFSGLGVAGTHTFENDKKINLLEIDGYFSRGDWTLQGQWAAGNAEGLAANGSTARWSGLSTLVGYKVTPRLQLIARADQIWNRKNGGGVLGSSISTTGQDGVNGFGRPMVFDGTNWVADGLQGVNRSALSLGTNYLISSNHTPNSGMWPTGTWFKTEIRYDAASGAVFQQAQDGSYKKNNLMFSSSLVFAF
jgi:hypothetical protein